MCFAKEPAHRHPARHRLRRKSHLRRCALRLNGSAIALQLYCSSSRVTIQFSRRAHLCRCVLSHAAPSAPRTPSGAQRGSSQTLETHLVCVFITGFPCLPWFSCQLVADTWMFPIFHLFSPRPTSNGPDGTDRKYGNAGVLSNVWQDNNGQVWNSQVFSNTDWNRIVCFQFAHVCQA